MTLTEEHLAQLAALSGLTIAPDHVPGVIRHLEVLLAQASLLYDPALPADAEPAPVFRP
jgi:hypothetical protein